MTYILFLPCFVAAYSHFCWKIFLRNSCHRTGMAHLRKPLNERIMNNDAFTLFLQRCCCCFFVFATSSSCLNRQSFLSIKPIAADATHRSIVKITDARFRSICSDRRWKGVSRSWTRNRETEFVRDLDSLQKPGSILSSLTFPLRSLSSKQL